MARGTTVHVFWAYSTLPANESQQAPGPAEVERKPCKYTRFDGNFGDSPTQMKAAGVNITSHVAA